ncbi:ribonuclease PH [Planctomicrobium piriforme]|uniref:Ribonuclease PH n=1 Tax=Planctomicrobium piriforme TaxID=1576369 RepID=A0A1I3S9Z6_9PLAN|nr:ribonuclease PH [Planctomicrobium piriforme]SFJ54336.1 ribonuclease PH [Planctomicrobium piriforme]
MTRHDGRSAEQLREIRIERPYFGAAPGRLLIQAGRTTILCTASVSNDLPPWKKKQENPAGWVTAEYSMLPGCTAPRKDRRTDGRATEIQRLIGRSLRAVIDMTALGPRQVTVDCDVLEADGGTRTLSITGGFIALVDAISSINEPGYDFRKVFRSSVAAVSVGVVNGQAVLDLDYVEDSQAEVDMNVVMTGPGAFVEVQGTAEGVPFQRDVLNRQLDLAAAGIAQLTALQRNTLGDKWPLDTFSGN